MTDCETVLQHLFYHGTLTPAEAYRRYGILRLGARIYDLRHAGYDIGKDMIYKTMPDGRVKKWAQYYLKGAQHE